VSKLRSVGGGFKTVGFGLEGFTESFFQGGKAKVSVNLLEPAILILQDQYRAYFVWAKVNSRKRYNVTTVKTVCTVLISITLHEFELRKMIR